MSQKFSKIGPLIIMKTTAKSQSKIYFKKLWTVHTVFSPQVPAINQNDKISLTFIKPLEFYSLDFFFLIYLAQIRNSLFLIQILFTKIMYVKGHSTFLLILLYLQSCDAQNDVKLILVSSACCKNSELTTTEDNHKEIFKYADEHKSNKGETSCNKDKKRKQLWLSMQSKLSNSTRRWL